MTSEHTNDRNANHELITTYVNAWEAGDVGTIAASYHDDIVVHYFGQNRFAGDHAGKPAVLKLLTEMSQLTNRKLIGVHDVLSGENHGAVLAEEEWQRDGKTLRVRRIFLYHIKDGQLAEAWAFEDDQRAVDEFWS